MLVLLVVLLLLQQLLLLLLQQQAAVLLLLLGEELGVPALGVGDALALEDLVLEVRQNGMFHLQWRVLASRVMMFLASLPNRPSRDTMKGAKSLHSSRHSSAYLRRFASSAARRTLSGFFLRYVLESRSLTWTSTMAVVP